MKHTNINYKAHVIQKRIDVKSHCAGVYQNGILIKMIAGNINADGSNNCIDKAKSFIDCK